MQSQRRFLLHVARTYKILEKTKNWEIKWYKNVKNIYNPIFNHILISATHAGTENHYILTGLYGVLNCKSYPVAPKANFRLKPNWIDSLKICTTAHDTLWTRIYRNQFTRAKLKPLSTNYCHKVPENCSARSAPKICRTLYILIWSRVYYRRNLGCARGEL